MHDIFDTEPEFIDMEGAALRIVRGGSTTGTPLLLTGPWPESLFAFYAVWPRLAALGPVVAVDLPGFGQSEWREDVMSPAKMGAFLLRLLDQLDLPKVHAIVPDVGTLAALFAAADRPDRFESIVAGSGGVAMELLGDPLRQIVNSDRGSFAGLDGGEQVVALIRSSARHPAPEAVIEDYRRSSASSRWNEAADYVRAYATDLPRLSGLLGRIETPVLVISGDADPFVPPANGERLSVALPSCVHDVVESGHFVWEDAYDRYADLVDAWVRGGYRAA